MNSGRHSGRVESHIEKALVTGPKAVRSANDSLTHLERVATGSSRLTSTKLIQVMAALSERDVAIVASVGKLRLVSTVQVQRLHFVDGTPASNARRCRLALKRLTDLRVLARLDRRIGGVRSGSSGFVYRLDAAGLAVAGVTGTDGRRRRPVEPGLPYVAHTLAVTELGVRATEAARQGVFELIEFTAEPACWRPFFGPSGARTLLKPDVFMRVGKGEFEHLWFVEVDRATESMSALKNKFRFYRQFWASGREQARWGDVFPRVLWLVPDVARHRKLIDVAGAQPPESWPLFAVRLYDDALGALAPEEES